MGYGKQVLEQLANSLATEFGKGFDITNLRRMRSFYLTYPIQETLSLELSWRHYCKLIRIENKSARDYVRVYDQHYKSEVDNPTIGLILCSEKSQAVAKYSVLTNSQQLFAAKYLPYLPTEEELRLELLRERQAVEGRQE